jgi:hypothetical protein
VLEEERFFPPGLDFTLSLSPGTTVWRGAGQVSEISGRRASFYAEALKHALGRVETDQAAVCPAFPASGGPAGDPCVATFGLTKSRSSLLGLK